MKKLIEKSTYYNVMTPSGPLHVHINYDEKGARKVFTSLPPIGTDFNNLVVLIGILITKYLEKEGRLEDLLKHLQSIKSNKSVIWEGQAIESVPHALAMIMQEHIGKNK